MFVLYSINNFGIIVIKISYFYVHKTTRVNVIYCPRSTCAFYLNPLNMTRTRLQFYFILSIFLLFSYFFFFLPKTFFSTVMRTDFKIFCTETKKSYFHFIRTCKKCIRNVTLNYVKTYYMVNVFERIHMRSLNRVFLIFEIVFDYIYLYYIV